MNTRGQLAFVRDGPIHCVHSMTHPLTNGMESTALTTALENQMKTSEAPAMMATSLLFSTPSHCTTSNARWSVSLRFDVGPPRRLRTRPPLLPSPRAS